MPDVMTASSAPPSEFKRSRIGWAALACLLSAAGLWWLAPGQEGVMAGLLRIGIVLGCLWLALPATGGSLAWNKIIPVIIGLAVLVAVSRRAFLFLLPGIVLLGILLALLRPRKKHRPGSKVR